MKAWNSFKNDCGSFVKNQIKWPLCQKKKISRNGKEYFTIVQMIVKDKGY